MLAVSWVVMYIQGATKLGELPPNFLATEPFLFTESSRDDAVW